VLHHVATAVGDSIVEGEIGAIATGGNDASDGYYLVEFIGTYYTSQSFDATLKCEGHWLYELPGAPKWFYKSSTKEEFDLMNVVMTGVEMIPFSPTNMPSSRARSQAMENNAFRISEDSHNFILDEILRRERIEYDPSRVYDDDDYNDDADQDED
jgi:hypothetical protein